MFKLFPKKNHTPTISNLKERVKSPEYYWVSILFFAATLVFVAALSSLFLSWKVLNDRLENSANNSNPSLLVSLDKEKLQKAAEIINSRIQINVSNPSL